MKRSLFLVTLAVAFACCTPTPMDLMEEVEYSVTDWENGGYSSLNKFDPMMANFEMIFNLVLDKNLIFRVASITYPTEDPNGNRVEASGLVYHPVNKKSKGVVDFLPMAHLNRDGGTSEDLFVAEGMLALLGYTVIVPDLLGSGASKEMMVPFLMTDNTGRVACDMHRAAAQYLWDEFRYALPAQTTILGYSLGGSAALATQKYMEKHYAHSIKIKEVHAGGGAYDLEAAFMAYAKTGISGYPAIPHTILAFDHYYQLGLDYTQVFSGDLLENNNYETWLHGEYDAAILKELLGIDLRAYMNEDFFKPFGQQNDEFKKLHPLLTKNSVTEGWRPKAPIYLTHSKSDAIVPVASAEAALSKLRKAGANISLMTYPGDHYTVGYTYFIRSILRSL